MPAPIVIAGIATVGRYLAKHGATAAIKKYGKRQVKAASQKITSGPKTNKLDPTFRKSQAGSIKGKRPAAKPTPQPKNTKSYTETGKNFKQKQSTQPKRAPIFNPAAKFTKNSAR